MVIQREISNYYYVKNKHAHRHNITDYTQTDEKKLGMWQHFKSLICDTGQELFYSLHF